MLWFTLIIFMPCSKIRVRLDFKVTSWKKFAGGRRFRLRNRLKSTPGFETAHKLQWQIFSALVVFFINYFKFVRDRRQNTI